MALLHDILKWTESLPSWQRDAARRLLQREGGLAESDYVELYELLKSENGIKVDSKLASIPLGQGHLPTELKSGEKVTLLELRNLENVNQIPNDRILRFAESGITVIYGGNGSGKSGYARVMKKACRARDQSEAIHPNANDPAAALKIPSATFVVKVAGKNEEVTWVRDKASPDRLSTISVFDSRCARSYITAEKDVAYLPYGLDIVENLANVVLPKLSERLEAEIGSLDISTLSFDHLRGETAVGKLINSLSIKSDSAKVSALAAISEDDTTRISEIELALKEANPLSRAQDLKLSAARFKAFANKLSKPLVWVSPEAIEKLKRLSDEKDVAEAAESKAADTLRAGEELLPGTGDQTWKLLFEAARRYSIEDACPNEEFPSETDGKVCPLCQQDLGDLGKHRLVRFDQYIRNDVAKRADLAREALKSAKTKIEQADLNVLSDEALCEELENLDADSLHTLKEFQKSIESRRSLMVSCLATKEWNEIPHLVESPRTKVRQLAARQLRSHRTLVRAADQAGRSRLENELAELSARRNLSKVLTPILDLLDRMKRRNSLEKCRPSLKTRGISDKSKELSSQAVTLELKKSLDKEFKALGIGHIKTKLKERSVKGKMFHQLLLDLPTSNKIDEILSEGEQRAIALGAFFAELAISNHSCGIVFDDPVSSLDHWRRRDVARRLSEESRHRQVIVFTHDTSFLGQLCDEIEATPTPNSMFFLEWRGGLPGSVNDGLPWDHQGYKERINVLEQAQSRLAKTWPAYPGEIEISELRHQYDRLRATLERVIQDVVFNGVVKRYRDWIRVDSLEEVVGFDHQEYEAIAKLHKRSSDVVTAHDQSSAKSAAIPTAADLGNDIALLKSIVDAVKLRRKSSKSAANPAVP